MEDPIAAEHGWLGQAESDARDLTDGIVEQTAALVTSPTDTHALNALFVLRAQVDDLIEELEDSCET